MKAIVVNRKGGPEVLEYSDLASPAPKASEVSVRVAAAGVNFIDVYLREGRYPATCPFVLGQEGSGIVEEVGEGVEDFKSGDRVAWAGVPGAYAELACVPANKLVSVPANLPLENACAVLLQGMTAHYLAYDTYPLKGGESILIHAGAGGVGLLLTQIAKNLGATVIATVSTDEKARLSYEAGADNVILYNHLDWVPRVRALAQLNGLPVVYDSVGQATFEVSLECLRPRGMLVLFGASSGAVPPFDLIRLSTLGSLYLTRPTLKDYIDSPVELSSKSATVFGDLVTGALKLPAVGQYPLRNAAQAHVELEGRRTTGKLLLMP